MLLNESFFCRKRRGAGCSPRVELCNALWRGERKLEKRGEREQPEGGEPSWALLLARGRPAGSLRAEAAQRQRLCPFKAAFRLNGGFQTPQPPPDHAGLTAPTSGGTPSTWLCLARCCSRREAPRGRNLPLERGRGGPGGGPGRAGNPFQAGEPHGGAPRV